MAHSTYSASDLTHLNIDSTSYSSTNEKLDRSNYIQGVSSVIDRGKFTVADDLSDEITRDILVRSGGHRLRKRVRIILGTEGRKPHECIITDVQITSVLLELRYNPNRTLKIKAVQAKSGLFAVPGLVRGLAGYLRGTLGCRIKEPNSGGDLNTSQVCICAASHVFDRKISALHTCSAEPSLQLVKIDTLLV